MASRSPRLEIPHSFTPGTARSSHAQRRRIHNAKNNRAKFMAAEHHMRVQNSLMALAALTWARFAA